MAVDKDDELDWDVRRFVYATIVERSLPPTADETAAAFGIAPDDARAAFARLDRRHALFLDPGSDRIRMAHPFSGVPTPFRVHANGRVYWANCAWDMLGVPAALGVDARIEATCADDGEPAEIVVRDGAVHGNGEVVHVLLPFRRWYDDLVFT